jgi:uncharacterized protein (TIGR02147 family)
MTTIANHTSYFRKKLKEELASRCSRNSRYSIRAFARALQIDVGALSRVLAGKQIPSFKLAQKIVDGLGLDKEERRIFLTSLAESQRERGLQRLSPIFAAFEESPKAKELSLEMYRVIADWYHAAILELTFVDEFQSNPRWIAKELGITIAEAKLAMERLVEFGLLGEKNGKLFKTNSKLTTADKHITTPALRKNQKQFLELATHSLENDPIEERSMTSMTMAIDPEKLPAAKEMIRDFNSKLCKFLESGKRKRVYNLEIGLYPVQKKGE